MKLNKSVHTGERWLWASVRIAAKLTAFVIHLVFFLYYNQSHMFVFEPDEIRLAISGRWVIDKPQLCPLPSPNTTIKSTDPRLLVLVNSAVGHFAARAALRDTWVGALRREGVRVYFVLAQPSQPPSTDQTMDYQAMIASEDHKYGDLLEVAVQDSYRNLTLKTLAMLRLVADRCALTDSVRFVLKADDDILLNVPLLLHWLRITKCRRAFFGRLGHRWGPVLEAGQKNYCPLFGCHSASHFPDFVVGPAYLFDVRLAAPVLHYVHQHEKTVIYIEDVYITGVVAQALNITRHSLFYHDIFPPKNMCEFGLGVVWAGLDSFDIREGWMARIIEGNCTTNQNTTHNAMNVLKCD